ncbi:MAG: carboxypeptidase regulatory-like domain-containing protein [Candidatus Micrarchaeia archaeon]
MKARLFVVIGVLAVFASFAWAGSIAGYVSNGTAYVGGATVRAFLLSDGTEINNTLTDANGFFNVSGLPDGNYNLSIYAPGYYELRRELNGPPGTTFVNNSDPARTDIYFNPAYYNFTLTPVNPATLEGYILNTSGQGIPGASVALYYNGQYKASDSTDGSGFYSISGLTLPAYEVRVTPPANYLPANTTVAVQFGQTNYLNLTLFGSPTNGSIYGTVRNGTGAPVGGAIIQALQGAVVRGSAVSDATGNYSISLEPGIYNVTATKTNYTSQTVTNVGVSAQVDFVINPIPPSATLSYLVVTPASASLAAGAQQAFTATAYYSDTSSQDVTSLANWSVTGGIGTVNASGVFTATTAGSGTVAATYQNVSNSSSVTVTPGPLYRLAISPASATVTIGYTQHFTASGLDYYNNSLGTINDAALEWSVSGDVGTIDAGGVFTATTVGSGTVMARYVTNTSINGTASVTVQAQQGGGGGAGGGGGGGGGESQNKSYLGQPCRTSDDCFYGQCINFICKVPEFGGPTGGENVSVTPPAANVTPPKETVQLLAPQIVEKGEEVVLTLLTLDGRPVAGARIVVMPPIDPSFTLLTNASGMTSFTALREGTYSFATPDYNLKSNVTTRAITVTPPAPPINVSPPAPVENVSNVTIATPPADFATALLNALRSGANSLVNAMSTSLPMWIVVGTVLFAALLLIVVYMVLYGIKRSEQAQRAKEVQPPDYGEGGEETIVSETSEGVTEKDLASLTFETKKEEGEAPEHEKEEEKREERPAGEEEDLEGLTRELEERLERLRKRRRETG